MAIHAYGNTVKGISDVNDDHCSINRVGDYIVFIIADGNGGKPGMVNIGNLATSLMLDYIKKIINETTSILDIRRQIELGMYTVSKSFLTANALDTKYENMYASMSVLVVSDVSLDMVMASVGNTEIQLFRRGKFSRLNTVHSEAFNALETKEIAEGEFYAHPKRRILTSALGVFYAPTIDCFSAKLEPNDIVFLTTDGVFMALTPDDVFKEMASHEGSKDELHDGVEGVLKKTIDNGGEDNAGLICIYIS